MKEVERILNTIRTENSITYQHNHDVELIVPIPDTKPIGYCYELFRPLSEQQIHDLVSTYRCHFPGVLMDFYRLTNGMFMFGRFIRIYGDPIWDADYKQPMALRFADGHRTSRCPKNRLFFAHYYTEPEIQLFFNTEECDSAMKVYAAKYGDNSIIAQWGSFEDWFIQEHERFSQMYAEGKYSYCTVVEDVIRNIEFDVHPLSGENR